MFSARETGAMWTKTEWLLYIITKPSPKHYQVSIIQPNEMLLIKSIVKDVGCDSLGSSESRVFEPHTWLLHAYFCSSKDIIRNRHRNQKFSTDDLDTRFRSLHSHIHAHHWLKQPPLIVIILTLFYKLRFNHCLLEYISLPLLQLARRS